jgi:hypothetical protein
MSFEPEWSDSQSGAGNSSSEGLLTLDEVIGLMMERLSDGLDHPELWPDIPEFAAHFPQMADTLAARLANSWGGRLHLAVLHALCVASTDPQAALCLLEPLAVQNSLSTLVQGALFHVQGLLDPGNDRYDLTDRICTTPFQVLDVLENSTHLCCASWIQQSAGDLNQAPWQDVWNSRSAQDIRASILDGSYRYCNKTACPHIGGNQLPTRAEVAQRSDFWKDIIENDRTEMAESPYRVNLAYDRTCNLSCPSCRTEKWAADTEIRTRYDKLQEEKILPMLKQTKLVFITGSGDPFASKNFRNLMERLTADEYPDLRFQIMTNGMLFTPREWERFPALHGRVANLRISLDAATGPTHELLRRGARWEVMERNLAFAAELRANGLVDSLDLAFTVQVENYREMGPAVDLANSLGADVMAFLRLTNWGTFTNEQYAARAVFMPSHPEFSDFVATMQDPRLCDKIVRLADLAFFVENEQGTKAA